ncbi:F-box protein [Tripterygium wilfordii]|uniref:F-box protein n=1 Tax=Tripterygium wilfordii TaxID=458696 RepID=A0A7J7E2K2_TRIWF|nr:F-box protein [Tripterygium wilfordii]
MFSRGRWGCQISDRGLEDISSAKCVSRANSLQHLNIGGTFITDASLFAIADNCPYLKSVILWSCRHVIADGILVLVSKCRRLESINIWGTRISVDCCIAMLTIRPPLDIKLGGLL